MSAGTFFLWSIIILFGVALGYTVTHPDPVIDRGQCLRGHPYHYTSMILVGKVMVPIQNQGWACDVWEFPTGRPDGGRP